ncbi:MAG: hypothetical protein AMXMBFR56_24470 [Polyangiaceae bacterium]
MRPRWAQGYGTAVPEEPKANDPRVYFAAERTLLAWVRTGITVIALGFVVARFGLFLQLVSPAAAPHASVGKGAVVGTVLVGMGALFTAVAGAQFLTFLKTLAPEERPRTRMAPTVSLLLAFAISGVGALLSVFLWL